MSSNENHIVLAGNRLADARRVAGLTQLELATRIRRILPPGYIGFSQAQISKMEKGRQLMRTAALKAVADVLGVMPEWILYGTEPREAERPGERQLSLPAKPATTKADRTIRMLIEIEMPEGWKGLA